MEEAWCVLVAGFRHDLDLLVFEGSFSHLVIHELVLLEHAQLHLRLHTHDLRDTAGYKPWDLEAGESNTAKKQALSPGDVLGRAPCPRCPTSRTKAGWTQISCSFLKPICLCTEEGIRLSCIQLFHRLLGSLMLPKLMQDLLCRARE